MAQRKSVAWSELKVGMLVIVAFLLLGVAVLRVGGTTSFFGKTMDFTVYFPTANGLREGAEVWVEGILVGNVESITLTKDPDPNKRVAVALKIDDAYSDTIKSDSVPGIGSIGLLGDRNVQISSGTANGTPIGDGGVLHGQEVGNIDRIITGTDDLILNLNRLSETAVAISENVNQGKGTLGKLLNDSEIHDNMNAAVLEMKTLITDIRSGPGTAGKLITDDTLYQRLNSTVERVENLIAKVDTGNGTVPKLLNDPSIYNKFDQLLERAESLIDRVDKGQGTLGKLVNDDGLYTDVRATMGKFNTLIDTVQSGDGTAGKLMKDPSLYNSLDQAASEIQKLIYDIKQDPKKYLTIQFRFF
jgi:phospholipid/cholesterol/gamma-HCH transport system substrate-binding protein